MRILFLVLLAFLKFLSFSFAGAVILFGGAYGTWSYYVTDLPTHWVFSFCGPLMIVAGIGMIVTMTIIFRDDLLDAACERKRTYTKADVDRIVQFAVRHERLHAEARRRQRQLTEHMPTDHVINSALEEKSNA